jgi:hypothetical protein
MSARDGATTDFGEEERLRRAIDRTPRRPNSSQLRVGRPLSGGHIRQLNLTQPGSDRCCGGSNRRWFKAPLRSASSRGCPFCRSHPVGDSLERQTGVIDGKVRQRLSTTIRASRFAKRRSSASSLWILRDPLITSASFSLRRLRRRRACFRGDCQEHLSHIR